ncbi:MAG: hypothetical protein K8I02_04030, partial [Candidatus Methylomirabilis sp.]|nr:hypothetical protein [Deltaproteobacteria bacterium]
MRRDPDAMPLTYFDIVIREFPALMSEFVDPEVERRRDLGEREPVPSPAELGEAREAYLELLLESAATEYVEEAVGEAAEDPEGPLGGEFGDLDVDLDSALDDPEIRALVDDPALDEAAKALLDDPSLQRMLASGEEELWAAVNLSLCEAPTFLFPAETVERIAGSAFEVGRKIDPDFPCAMIVLRGARACDAFHRLFPGAEGDPRDPISAVVAMSGRGALRRLRFAAWHAGVR